LRIVALCIDRGVKRFEKVAIFVNLLIESESKKAA
jgi:hypothetical protein